MFRVRAVITARVRSVSRLVVVEVLYWTQKYITEVVYSV